MRRSFVPVVLALVLLAGCSGQQVEQLQSALVVAEEGYQDAKGKADSLKPVVEQGKDLLRKNLMGLIQFTPEQLKKITDTTDEAIAKYDHWTAKADGYSVMVVDFTSKLENMDLTEKPSLINALRVIEAGAGIAAPAAGPAAGYVQLGGIAAGLLATILGGTTLHQRGKRKEEEEEKDALAADLTSVVKAIDRARNAEMPNDANNPLDKAMRHPAIVSALHSMGTDARDRVDEIQNGGIAA